MEVIKPMEVIEQFHRSNLIFLSKKISKLHWDWTEMGLDKAGYRPSWVQTKLGLDWAGCRPGWV
jgi:hypothetical protein